MLLECSTIITSSLQESQARLSNVSCLKQVHSQMRSHLIVKGKTLTNVATLGPESQKSDIPLGQGLSEASGWLMAHLTLLGPGSILTAGAKLCPRD